MNVDVSRQDMLSAICRLRAVAIFTVLNACASHITMAEEAIERPSLAEIRLIEAQIRMPRGAASIGEYFRYYFMSKTDRPRVIVGMYVEKSELESLEPSEIPATDIVVVESDADVPAPWDAGCSVVTVTYVPRGTQRVNAWCDPELTVESLSYGNRFTAPVALASLLGILLAGCVWFWRRSIARWLRRFRHDAAQR
jgi:hypothetical protein